MTTPFKDNPGSPNKDAPDKDITSRHESNKGGPSKGIKGLPSKEGRKVSRPEKFPEFFSDHITKVVDETLFKNILENSHLSIVIYSSLWCSACHKLTREFNDLAKENPDVKCIRVDVDEAQELAIQAGIKLLPTFIIYEEGKPMATVTSRHISDLQKALKKALSKKKEVKRK